MIVLANRNVNLHSKSVHNGLVHLRSGKKARVPDDVRDHPGFDLLVDGGAISILSDKVKAPEAEILRSSKSAAGEKFGVEANTTSSDDDDDKDDKDDDDKDDDDKDK